MLVGPPWWVHAGGSMVVGPPSPLLLCGACAGGGKDCAGMRSIVVCEVCVFVSKSG